MSRFFGFTLPLRTLAIVLVMAAPGLGQDVARMEEVVRSLTPDNRSMGTVLVAHGETVLLNRGYGSVVVLANMNGPAADDLGAKLSSLAHEGQTGAR